MEIGSGERRPSSHSPDPELGPVGLSNDFELLLPFMTDERVPVHSSELSVTTRDGDELLGEGVGDGVGKCSVL